MIPDLLVFTLSVLYILVTLKKLYPSTRKAIKKEANRETHMITCQQPLKA